MSNALISFLRPWLLIAALITSLEGAILRQGFDRAGDLEAEGWIRLNRSSPQNAVAGTGWFQGNPGVFSSFSGSQSSYLAANFNNAAFGGTIDNWLLSPVFAFGDPLVLTFAARTYLTPEFGDRLQVWLSQGGESMDVGASSLETGDFSTLLLDITAMPSVWSTYAASLRELKTGSGRIGFRYFVEDTSIAGDYIGIDSVRIGEVSEPASAAFLSIGIIALVSWSRRQRGQFSVTGNK